MTLTARPPVSLNGPMMAPTGPDPRGAWAGGTGPWVWPVDFHRQPVLGTSLSLGKLERDEASLERGALSKAALALSTRGLEPVVASTGALSGRASMEAAGTLSRCSSVPSLVEAAAVQLENQRLREEIRAMSSTIMQQSSRLSQLWQETNIIQARNGGSGAGTGASLIRGVAELSRLRLDNGGSGQGPPLGRASSTGALLDADRQQKHQPLRPGSETARSPLLSTPDSREWAGCLGGAAAQVHPGWGYSSTAREGLVGALGRYPSDSRLPLFTPALQRGAAHARSSGALGAETAGPSGPGAVGAAGPLPASLGDSLLKSANKADLLTPASSKQSQGLASGGTTPVQTPAQSSCSAAGGHHAAKLATRPRPAALEPSAPSTPATPARGSAPSPAQVSRVGTPEAEPWRAGQPSVHNGSMLSMHGRGHASLPSSAPSTGRREVPTPLIRAGAPSPSQLPPPQALKQQHHSTAEAAQARRPSGVTQPRLQDAASIAAEDAGPSPACKQPPRTNSSSRAACTVAASPTAPEGLLACERSPQCSPARVGLSFTIQKVDHGLLMRNPILLGHFREAIKQAIVSEAGAGLTTDRVELALSAGSVIVQVTVTPPSGVPAGAMQSRLSSAFGISNAVASRICQLDGISAVSTGVIHVTNVSAPTLSSSFRSPMDEPPPPKPLRSPDIEVLPATPTEFRHRVVEQHLPSSTTVAHFADAAVPGAAFHPTNFGQPGMDVDLISAPAALPSPVPCSTASPSPGGSSTAIFHGHRPLTPMACELVPQDERDSMPMPQSLLRPGGRPAPAALSPRTSEGHSFSNRWDTPPMQRRSPLEAKQPQRPEMAVHQGNGRTPPTKAVTHISPRQPGDMPAGGKHHQHHPERTRTRKASTGSDPGWRDKGSGRGGPYFSADEMPDDLIFFDAPNARRQRKEQQAQLEQSYREQEEASVHDTSAVSQPGAAGAGRAQSTPSSTRRHGGKHGRSQAPFPGWEGEGLGGRHRVLSDDERSLDCLDFVEPNASEEGGFRSRSSSKGSIHLSKALLKSAATGTGFLTPPHAAPRPQQQQPPAASARGLGAGGRFPLRKAPLDEGPVPSLEQLQKEAHSAPRHTAKRGAKGEALEALAEAAKQKSSRAADAVAQDASASDARKPPGRAASKEAAAAPQQKRPAPPSLKGVEEESEPAKAPEPEQPSPAKQGSSAGTPAAGQGRRTPAGASAKRASKPSPKQAAKKPAVKEEAAEEEKAAKAGDSSEEEKPAEAKPKDSGGDEEKKAPAAEEAKDSSPKEGEESDDGESSEEESGED